QESILIIGDGVLGSSARNLKCDDLILQNGTLDVQFSVTTYPGCAEPAVEVQPMIVIAMPAYDGPISFTKEAKTDVCINF
ncbi:MAG: hypothetical protein ABI743_10170, partial [bacterium]